MCHEVFLLSLNLDTCFCNRVKQKNFQTNSYLSRTLEPCVYSVPKDKVKQNTIKIERKKKHDYMEYNFFQCLAKCLSFLKDVIKKNFRVVKREKSTEIDAWNDPRGLVSSAKQYAERFHSKFVLSAL